MIFIGVDGCKGGWFFTRRQGRQADCGVVAKLEEVLPSMREAFLLLVDIPIGLRNGSGLPRACDTAARRLLGPKRAPSVFPAPVRGVLGETDYLAAVAESKRLTGKSLSRQAFAIVPKVREVDALLSGDTRARDVIREVHPEVCFWALNGCRPMAYRKKSKEGFAERMNVLRQVLPEAEDLCEKALAQYPRKIVARDDIADALVALATATVPLARQLTVPANPEKDALGLPMQMVYALGPAAAPTPGSS